MEDKIGSPAWLEEMTWREFADVIKDNKIIVIPVGAAAKEHGPHLPLNTDYLLAREFVQRVSRHVEIIAAPVIRFGYYPAFASYPGSLGISDTLFYELVYSVLTGLVNFGVEKVAILNTGVSTTPMLEKVVRTIEDEFNITVLLLNIRDLFYKAKTELGLTGDISHADAMETSLVMAIDENVVRLDRIEGTSAAFKLNSELAHSIPLPLDPDDPDSPAYCPSGVLGDPAHANKETGDRLFNEMALIINSKFKEKWA